MASTSRSGFGNVRDMKWLVPGVLVTVLLTACGDSTATAPGPAAGGGNGGADPTGSVTVSVGANFFRSIRNGSMNAAVDTVVVGEKVTWRWTGAGSVPHNVASVGMPSFTSGGIQTGDGSTYELTFTSPGTYRYNCAIHGNLMTGMVVVTAQ
jgi:plastocyanin